MPRAIAGERVPLNLLLLQASNRQRLVLNLGVDGDYVEPPDPGEMVGELSCNWRFRWDGRESMSIHRVAAWGGSATTVQRAAVIWGGHEAMAATVSAGWGGLSHAQAGAHLLWAAGDAGIASRTRLPWDTPPRHDAGVFARWAASAANAARGARSPWASPPRAGAAASMRWRGLANTLGVAAIAAWNAPPVCARNWRFSWGQGHGLEWVVRPPTNPPEPPEPRPVDGRFVGLNLGCPVFAGDARRLPLNLGLSECWMGRTQRRIYVVLNEISVVRLPDRLPIEVDSIGIAGGRDTWCWDLRLSLLQPEQLPALAPTTDGPRRVEVTINGYRWVFAIENFARGRAFNSSSIELSGRSVSAQLADPYAAARSRAEDATRTMAQLAEYETVGTELSVSYDTVDWLVTGGAWYYDALTPISALTRLAEGAGAVVQSDPEAATIRIRPRYPVSPWEWTTTTPDAIVQDDLVTGERLQLQSRPPFDAVIVAGEQLGVAAKVRRDGEAGQTFAPQQIDQLITHADGARERGRNVLSDRGGQASVELDLPLFAQPVAPDLTGLVLPLMLVRRVGFEGTWHGLATAVRISATRSDKAIDVVQTITLERHYNDAD